MPSQTLPSFAVRLSGSTDGAQSVATKLRHADPPVVSRVQDGEVQLDVRTVLPRDERMLRKVLLEHLS